MVPRHKRHSRKFRRTGYIFLIIASLIVLAALNSGSNLLYLVFSGLASFVVLSAVVSRLTLRGIVMVREAPQAVNHGDPFAVIVRLENRKPLFPAVALRVESARRPGESVGFILKIPARRAAVLRVSEKFDKRGVHRLPPFVLISTFPFGLIESRLELSDTAEVVVYPRVLAARVNVLERTLGSGDTSTVGQGRGDEFFSLRDYMPGDDIRHIAWRASARLGNWIVKELQQETSRLVLFMFDTRKRTDLEDFEERFEEAVELVASLATTLLNRQYRVALVTRTGSLPEGEGRGQAHKVLDFLARVAPCAYTTEGGDTWAPPLGDTRRAVLACVSPDPREWGVSRGPGGGRVLDPREVVRA